MTTTSPDLDALRIAILAEQTAFKVYERERFTVTNFSPYPIDSLIRAEYHNAHEVWRSALLMLGMEVQRYSHALGVPVAVTTEGEVLTGEAAVAHADRLRR